MCQGLSYNSTSFPNIWLMIPHQQSAEELLQDYMVRLRADVKLAGGQREGERGVNPWEETHNLHRVGSLQIPNFHPYQHMDNSGLISHCMIRYQELGGIFTFC